MGHPFNMYTNSSMYTEILFQSRVTHICWMNNNPDGHMLMDLGFKNQKTNLGIKIHILKIPSVSIFRENEQI